MSKDKKIDVLANRIDSVQFTMDILSDFRKSLIFIPREHYNVSDNTNQEKKIIWVSHVDKPKFFPPDMPKNASEDFEKLILGRIEAITYFERSTIKGFNSFNNHMPSVSTQHRSPFGQYIYIEIIKGPLKVENLDDTTVINNYRIDYIRNHNYVIYMKNYLKQFGIMYFVDYDPNYIINNIKLFLANEKFTI